jgi:cellulose synthase/poly-beta-1,6-N-acetylglucosamine synthase-like glycosyltransferase
MIPDWAAWVGVAFVVTILLELLRVGSLLLRNLREEPRIDPVPNDWFEPSLPRVSVVVPANNEQGVIEESVRSILESDYSNLELIIVDDRSSDRTPVILERLAESDSRIIVDTVKELPEGWTGKTHALYHGSKRASGDIILFLDADVLIGKDVISRCLAFFLRNNVGMFSMIPGFIKRGFSENVISPHLALGISYFYPLTDVNDQNKSTGLASGSFIMIKREVYESVGTWKRFRNEITEDVAISKAVKRHGHRLIVVRGHSMVRTRGFERVSDACRFWRRTYYGGLEKSVTKVARLTASYSALTLLPFLVLFSGVKCALGTASPAVEVLLTLSIIAILAIIVPLSIFLQQEGGKWAYGLTAPLGIIVSVWVGLTTLLALIGDRGIRWRGSTYH